MGLCLGGAFLLPQPPRSKVKKDISSTKTFQPEHQKSFWKDRSRLLSCVRVSHTDLFFTHSSLVLFSFVFTKQKCVFSLVWFGDCLFVLFSIMLFSFRSFWTEFPRVNSSRFEFALNKKTQTIGLATKIDANWRNNNEVNNLNNLQGVFWCSWPAMVCLPHGAVFLKESMKTVLRTFYCTLQSSELFHEIRITCRQLWSIYVRQSIRFR